MVHTSFNSCSQMSTVCYFNQHVIYLGQLLRELNGSPGGGKCVLNSRKMHKKEQVSLVSPEPREICLS